MHDSIQMRRRNLLGKDKVSEKCRRNQAVNTHVNQSRVFSNLLMKFGVK